MLHHVILWKIKDDITDKDAVKAQVKSGLEGLKGVIPGIEKMEVITCGLETSTCDIMLDSVFTDEAALKAYAVHPEHVKVADNYVRPNMAVRMCMDYMD